MFTQLFGDVLALLDRLAETDNTATIRRAAMLFQVKRMLTAHALAEEDIIYPMLHDDAHCAEEAKKLYREHADIKVRLFELEHKASQKYLKFPDQTAWVSLSVGYPRMVATRPVSSSE